MTPEHLIIIVSVLGGVIGGMGLGGGTLLIPLLTIGAGLEQHLAQAVNLIAFVPMSVVALAVHKKNGYVCFKQATPVTVVALLSAIAGSFGAGMVKGYALRAAFGVFLLCIGVYQTISTVIKIRKNKKNKSQSAKPKSV